MMTRTVKRLARVAPLVELLRFAQIAVLAGKHLSKLDREERRRLAGLVRQSRGRPSRLTSGDAEELRHLLSKLEPRLFAGSAVDKLSPFPVPNRLLYGRRDNPARIAARQSKDRSGAQRD
jgi:hypothetical protein